MITRYCKDVKATPIKAEQHLRDNYPRPEKTDTQEDIIRHLEQQL